MSSARKYTIKDFLDMVPKTPSRKVFPLDESVDYGVLKKNSIFVEAEGLPKLVYEEPLLHMPALLEHIAVEEIMLAKAPFLVYIYNQPNGSSKQKSGYVNTANSGLITTSQTQKVAVETEKVVTDAVKQEFFLSLKEKTPTPVFKMWKYYDLDHEIRGPFPSSEMHTWTQDGYFDHALLSVLPVGPGAPEFFSPLSSWKDIYDGHEPWDPIIESLTITLPARSKSTKLASVEDSTIPTTINIDVVRDMLASAAAYNESKFPTKYPAKHDEVKTSEAPPSMKNSHSANTTETSAGNKSSFGFSRSQPSDSMQNILFKMPEPIISTSTPTPNAKQADSPISVPVAAGKSSETPIDKPKAPKKTVESTNEQPKPITAKGWGNFKSSSDIEKPIAAKTSAIPKEVSAKTSVPTSSTSTKQVSDSALQQSGPKKSPTFKKHVTFVVTDTWEKHEKIVTPPLAPSTKPVEKIKNGSKIKVDVSGPSVTPKLSQQTNAVTPTGTTNIISKKPKVSGWAPAKALKEKPTQDIPKQEKTVAPSPAVPQPIQSSTTPSAKEVSVKEKIVEKEQTKGWKVLKSAPAAQKPINSTVRVAVPAPRPIEKGWAALSGKSVAAQSTHISVPTLQIASTSVSANTNTNTNTSIRQTATLGTSSHQTVEQQKPRQATKPTQRVQKSTGSNTASANKKKKQFEKKVNERQIIWLEKEFSNYNHGNEDLDLPTLLELLNTVAPENLFVVLAPLIPDQMSFITRFQNHTNWLKSAIAKELSMVDGQNTEPEVDEDGFSVIKRRSSSYQKYNSNHN